MAHMNTWRNIQYNQKKGEREQTEKRLTTKTSTNIRKRLFKNKHGKKQKAKNRHLFVLFFSNASKRVEGGRRRRQGEKKTRIGMTLTSVTRMTVTVTKKCLLLAFLFSVLCVTTTCEADEQRPTLQSSKPTSNVEPKNEARKVANDVQQSEQSEQSQRKKQRQRKEQQEQEQETDNNGDGDGDGDDDETSTTTRVMVKFSNDFGAKQFLQATATAKAKAEANMKASSSSSSSASPTSTVATKTRTVTNDADADAYADDNRESYYDFSFGTVTQFHRSNALAMDLTTSQIEQLKHEHFVESIEVDSTVRWFGSSSGRSTANLSRKKRTRSATRNASSVSPPTTNERESKQSVDDTQGQSIPASSKNLRRRVMTTTTTTTTTTAIDEGDDVEEEVEEILTVNHEQEVIPYGIHTVQGTSNAIPTPRSQSPSPPASSYTLADDDCFRICVIDSGLMVSHNDIPYNYSSADLIDAADDDDEEYIINNSNIMGQIFGLDADDYTWYTPTALSDHGTHVTGTIVATGGNSQGVAGVLPNAAHDGFCLLIARVFDESGRTSTSHIDAAVEWCADHGSRVINMSLGGDSRDQVSEDIYNSIWEEGVLVVSAAGNDGNDAKSYPASLETVLSVAAIDETNTIARFSQFNDQVNISAPGVRVWSTSAVVGVRLHPIEKDFFADLMEESILIGENDAELKYAPFVDCQRGFSKCNGAKDKVCIIERGETFFWEKANSCQEGGGIGAVIYNNVNGTFSGTLTPENSGDITIPVVSLSKADGEFLLQASADDTVSEISLLPDIPGYARYNGTSMASPHVAGVAAKIWGARPHCTNRQIREALIGTALDLGPVAGRDDYYGHGVVQAVDAYNYLLEQFEEPCGLLPVPSSMPSYGPTTEPTSLPSSTPTEDPSSPPSSVPSSYPSDQPTEVPSIPPTFSPTMKSSMPPTDIPTTFPTDTPTKAPTFRPTTSPTTVPTQSPTDHPSSTPSDLPTHAGCFLKNSPCTIHDDCCSNYCMAVGVRSLTTTCQVYPDDATGVGTVTPVDFDSPSNDNYHEDDTISNDTSNDASLSSSPSWLLQVARGSGGRSSGGTTNNGKYVVNDPDSSPNEENNPQEEEGEEEVNDHNNDNDGGGDNRQLSSLVLDSRRRQYQPKQTSYDGNNNGDSYSILNRIIDNSNKNSNKKRKHRNRQLEDRPFEKEEEDTTNKKLNMAS